MRSTNEDTQQLNYCCFSKRWQLLPSNQWFWITTSAQLRISLRLFTEHFSSRAAACGCPQGGVISGRTEGNNCLLYMSVTLLVSMATHSQSWGCQIFRRYSADILLLCPMISIVPEMSPLKSEKKKKKAQAIRKSPLKTHFPIILFCFSLKRPLLMNRAARGAFSWEAEIKQKEEWKHTLRGFIFKWHLLNHKNALTI